MSRISLFFCLVLVACQPEIIEIQPKGSDYFPLAEGFFVAYNVRQSLYALNQSPQELRYQLRDVYEKISNDTYRVVRYRRSNGIENWTVLRHGLVQKNANFVLRQDGNIPLVVLSFPLQENKSWNGNAYNNLGKQNFVMRNIGSSLKLGQHNFEKSVLVIQRMDSSLIDKYTAQEIYAQNVGLVYQKIEDLVYCQQSNCLGQKIIESGSVFEMSVFDFSKP